MSMINRRIWLPRHRAALSTNAEHIDKYLYIIVLPARYRARQAEVAAALMKRRAGFPFFTT